MVTALGRVPVKRGPGGRVSSATVLAVACLGAFLAFLDATVVNVAFPNIRQSFGGVGIGELSWVLNAYNIVLAATLVVFGRLADLVGRRRVFALGVALFSVASVLCAAADSVWWLVAARAVQALGAAMLVPASLALVIQAFPAQRRVHAVGLWGATAAAAAGLGPPIGGALVQWGSWRWAFLVNVPVGAAALVLSRRLLVESRSPGRRRLPDLRGALLLALAMGLLTTAIVTGNDWGWGSAGVLLCGAGAVLAAAGFVQSSRVHPSPLVDPAMLGSRGFVVANTASAVAGVGFYAYLLTNVLWLQYIWGYGVLRSGLALVPGAVVAALSAAALGRVAERWGSRLVVVPGAIIWASAYLWYATAVDLRPDFLGQWLPGQLISGLGVGATLPILGSAALESVPRGRYAVASAVSSSVRQVGGVLGIAVLVVLIGNPTPASAPDAFRRGWVFSAVCFVLCALVALWPARSRRGSVEAEAVPAFARLSVPDPDETDVVPAATQTPSLMEELDPAARESLLASSSVVRLAAGAVLFGEGDEADGAYSVVSGRLDVHTSGGLRPVGAGDVIGELAMLTGGRRSATVTARRDSILRRIEPQVLDKVLEEHPHAARSLTRVLAAQLSRPPAPSHLRPPSIVAVVGLHEGAPTEEVAVALRLALSHWLTVAAVGPVNGDGLQRAELSHDRVLLTASSPVGDRRWWETAVRQADVVVAVADGQLAAGSGHDTVPAGADLVLVGGAPGPDARAAWSRSLTAWQVTAVPSATPAALRGVASRLAGRSLGLVLAGGGARAFAHLGVLQALEEVGVAVDRVAGCSVGAVVAALHASGRPAAESRELVYAEFVRGRPFSDYTLPLVALAKGQRRRRALARAFDGVPIEALPLQFRCVSTDLLSRQVVVHRSGPLVPALMASTALPGLFPPVRMDGRLLVDGGVLSNLPVEALTERPEGPVVAVNISMGGGTDVPRDGTAGAGDHVLAAPRPPRMPALVDTLLRTMLIGSGGAAAAAQAAGHVVVTPPPMGVGLLEFHQLDVLVEAGLVAGRRLLADPAFSALL